MGTQLNEEFSLPEDQFPMAEDFDVSDNILLGETNGKLCSEPLEGALLGDPDNCGMCGGKLVTPRMLYCLHVFCEQCLEKKLIGDAGDAGSPNASIVCPTCGFESQVGVKKISALLLDVTKTNVSDVSHTSTLTCTSCTAKEVAKSKCNTCHNLLCANCDSAHHYMRCFESHRVVELEDMRKRGVKITIHKPLDCDVHPGESVAFNCAVCNSLICCVCAKTEHMGHPTEGVSESEVRVRQEMESLLTKSKDRLEKLAKCAAGLDANMEELAHQRSSARDLINESYQSYKAVLERRRDAALDELNELYHERELKIMKQSDEMGRAIGNLEDACRYTSRLLDTGTVLEMMYLRQIIASRLLTLNSSSPRAEASFSVEFKSDFDNFEKMVGKHFGVFLTETAVVVGAGSPMPSPGSPESIAAPMLNGTTVASKTASLANGGSPISLPASMQSSFDGADISNNLPPNFGLTQSPPPSQLPSHMSGAAPTLQGFSSIAEFNLAQLATLAENSNSAGTSPTPPFNFVDILTNDTAYKNLASLAKIGLNAADANQTITNGSNMLVRSTSVASLNLGNNLMNGFGGVSTSASPLLSTPDDIIQDPTLGTMLPSGGNNPNPAVNRGNKVSPMQIRCKFGQLGPGKGQFNSPHGFCLGLEEDIIVADTNNHRIQIFEKTGSFKFQFGIPGKDEGQLWYPRKVAVMRSTGKYVVCDRGNERSRMQIFTKNGHFLKKIAIRYIDIVAGLAVTGQGEIVAVDSVSPTVFIIHENGNLLRWFDCSDYMREPSDIAIHGKEFYVCDFKGHNVVVFNDDGQFLRRIGCENLTNFPNGIDISDAGDVLIGDSHGNRFHVAVFARDGSLISEFECPYVKVSRCCGLKITSEGYVVTLAKNNHHVLVLNTLYIL
ncbi:brain tumor protein-like [Cylas formicarius]|uniref:brain tumor protein-like n=1 Tax=Cylas formicarius TaxID=197179 RepID=UPI002958CFC4|nr:brain tumor protein-like [Cylas formicarius]